MRKLVVHYALVLPALAILAKAPAVAQRYSFQQYGPDQGLGNSVIRSIYQDKRGFLWVATENGLCRSDALRFSCYGTTDGLPGSDIGPILETPDGVLWAG
ncbi:MAG: two-component regulator propeller domain-containing protein, partial [Bryobacteraceae bacterium]